MSKRKILFIDRDGTLIDEPIDKQIDSLEKLQLEPDVIPALLMLKRAGFEFVMVSNQDGLGTESFSQKDFELPQKKLLDILASQGILFSDIRICPHIDSDGCECRKPKLGLLMDYLREQQLDRDNCYVIGDRKTDVLLAENMGIQNIFYDKKMAWLSIAEKIINSDRCAEIKRYTKETNIDVTLNLDKNNIISVKTGIGFFDHMLEQLAKHAGISMTLNVVGDLHIDEHHTVEDVAIAIGSAIKKALGDKLGINRYGFLMPMDEALSYVALDLGGRSYFVFEGNFQREKVGELPTELIPHFFRSLSDAMTANLHMKVTGENEHHMAEGLFKGFARALRMAIQKVDNTLPTTKGIL